MSRSHIFRKVTIIGVGLMGGSLGSALKKMHLAKEVVGYSHRQSTLIQALEQKTIDHAEPDLNKAIRNADLIVLATPVDIIINTLTSIANNVRRNTIITDMGSTKAEIVETAKKVLPNPGMFVGSHPLVGSEQRGVQNASGDIFHDGLCIMTPTEQTSQMAKEKVKLMWTKLGSHVHFMSPVDHDEILAYISHLPHLLAYGLVEAVPTQNLTYATQSLLDTTRVASSPPQIWNDICLTNSKNIIKALDVFIKTLAKMRKSIAERNQRDLTYQFTKAKEKRDGIKPKQ